MNGLERLRRDLNSRDTFLLVLETSVVFLNNILAFVGNLLTLIVVLRSPRLRTIPNKFVISLAISDILMAIPGTIFTTAVLIKSDWPFDSASCQFQGYFGLTLAFASSGTLALMSLNRYYLIVKPNNYRRIFTARRTSIMIFIAWFIAFLVQLLYVAGGHRYVFHPGKIFCNQDGSKPFSMILVSLFGAVPMIIISFCCLKVFRSVRAHNKRCSRDVAWSRVNVEDIKVSRILLMMVLAYALCSLPVVVTETIDFFMHGSYLPRQAYLFSTIAATLSISVNPIIYGVMNRTFRQEYKRLLRWNRIFKVGPTVVGQTNLHVISTPGQTGVSPAENIHAELTGNFTQDIRELKEP